MFWDVVLRSAGLWMILSLAAGQLTEQEKSTLVDMHNKLRSKVHPSAAFMQKVVRCTQHTLPGQIKKVY